MNTTYKEIFGRFLNTIKSYDFYSMAENEVYDIVSDYFLPAIVLYDNCTEDLEDRDDALGEFNFTASSHTIITLVNYMVVVWLESNFINTQLMLTPHLSSTDMHSYTNKDLLDRIITIRDSYLERADRRSINHGYKKSKLFDVVTNKKR